VLHEAGAICMCEQHGWMQAPCGSARRERAFRSARLDTASGLSPEAAAVATISSTSVALKQGKHTFELALHPSLR
jgi:hypothetical protein